VKSSKRALSSGDYFYFCNRKNKLVEWGVMRAAIPLGCCVVGVAES